MFVCLRGLRGTAQPMQGSLESAVTLEPSQVCYPCVHNTVCLLLLLWKSLSLLLPLNTARWVVLPSVVVVVPQGSLTQVFCPSHLWPLYSPHSIHLLTFLLLLFFRLAKSSPAGLQGTLCLAWQYSRRVKRDSLPGGRKGGPHFVDLLHILP